MLGLSSMKKGGLLYIFRFIIVASFLLNPNSGLVQQGAARDDWGALKFSEEIQPGQTYHWIIDHYFKDGSEVNDGIFKRGAKISHKIVDNSFIPPEGVWGTYRADLKIPIESKDWINCLIDDVEQSCDVIPKSDEYMIRNLFYLDGLPESSFAIVANQSTDGFVNNTMAHYSSNNFNSTHYTKLNQTYTLDGDLIKERKIIYDLEGIMEYYRYLNSTSEWIVSGYNMTLYDIQKTKNQVASTTNIFTLFSGFFVTYIAYRSIRNKKS
jgi:hypothetical protein